MSLTSAQADPSMETRNGVLPTTTHAVIRLIPVGPAPLEVAVDDDDDTVYVTNFTSNAVSVIDGRSGLDTTDTIPVGSGPFGIAVDSIDDTIYVTNYFSNNLSVINGRTHAASTVPTGSSPAVVGVNQDDDTVYVTSQGSNNLSIIDGRNPSPPSTISVGHPQRGVAVDQFDDTVYVTNFDTNANTVSVIDGRTRNISTITVGTEPFAIAVDQSDDTVYVANYRSNSVSVINGRTRSVSSITVGTNPSSVAINQVDGTVYVTNRNSDTVSILNGRTGMGVDDSITVSDGPYDVAVDNAGTNQGLVYVVSFNTNTLSVISRVTPTLGTPSGNSGDAVTINLATPQVSYAVDDSTISSVSFGDDTLTPTRQAGNSWVITAPAGAPGTSVPVTVTFRGGLTASAGTFTYAMPPSPAPPPVFPSSAPLEVTAVSGDARATVAWAAPTDSGSFPVTNYQVRSIPARGSCLTGTLTCTIDGLANGTAYSFEVRALNGAGWGPWSAMSNSITPEAPKVRSITISGSRGTSGQRQIVTVTGSSTGLDGTQVRAHVKLRGQADYQPGSFVDLTDDGSFTWQLSTGKKTYVYFTGGGVRSNRVIISASTVLSVTAPSEGAPTTTIDVVSRR